jgi:hypothetical protein
MSKNNEQNVKKLIALGYSKSKSQKALKDCGNNFNQAKTYLEATKAEEAKKAQIAESEAKAAAAAEAEKKRVAEAKKNGTHGKPVDPPPQYTRRHPCTAQYGACRYGANCAFRFMPADTCINYVVGSCVFGEYCRNRHTIDGHDIRKLMMPEGAREEYIVDPSDPNTAILLSGKGSVLDGVRVAMWEDDGSEEYAMPAPEASAFNAERGVAPSHSDPMAAAHAASMWGGDEGPASKPSPFLAMARSAGADPTPMRHAPGSTVVQPTSHYTPPQAPESIRHPCIAQCGQCRFGDACNHAMLRSDVCVHWLNGRCKFEGDDCHYMHEKVYPAAADAVLILPTAVNLDKPRAKPGGAEWSPTLQPHGSASFNEPSWDSLRFETPTSSALAGEIFSAMVVNKVENNSGGRWRGPMPGESEVLPGMGSAVLRDDDADEEARAFASLSEVFPHVHPEAILCALRQCGRDRQRVAQLIVDSTPDEVERNLLRQEQAGGDARDDYTGVTLLTLCALLPAMEPASLAAVLESCDGDFASAYRDASATTENIVGSDAANRWNTDAASSPASKLKLQKLAGMFQDLPTDVVEEAFRGAHGKLQDAIATLNVFTTDDKATDADAREQAGMRAVTATMGTPVTRVVAKQREAPPADDFGFTVTSGQEDPQPPLLSTQALYHQTLSEMDGSADWRRVRHEAYCVGQARAQCVSLAVAAYGRRDHSAGRALLLRGKQLKVRYERLNMMAMHALEKENGTEHLHTLDLHGFHVEEAVDVLHRRLVLLRRQYVGRLRVIVGRGLHSRNQGHSVVFPRVLEFLDVEEQRGQLQVTSIKPAEVHVRLVLIH